MARHVSAVLTPIVRSSETAVTASGFTVGASVVVGLARPRPTALLPPHSNGKPEAATAVVVAPDDGHEDAQNVLELYLNEK
jgi:hypothetical protein